MRTLKLTTLLSCLSFYAFAGPPDSTSVSNKDSKLKRVTISYKGELKDSVVNRTSEDLGSTPMSTNSPLYLGKFGKAGGITNFFGRFGTQDNDNKKGITQNNLKVSGVLRFLTIYRNMQESYDDMITSEKNISFLDYPLANVGSANGGGYPMLEINLSSNISKEFSYSLGYSFAHSFAGNTDGDAGKALSSRQNLMFTGNYNSKFTKMSLSAGGIMWTGISRFTMGQANYRDDYFTRVPWDWHRDSWTRYQEYYDFTANIGAEAAGRSPVKGFVLNGTNLPLALSWTAVYGRTNRNAVQSQQTTFFPTHTYAFRVAKNVFTKRIDGNFGLNYYKKDADIDRINGQNDDSEILSLDYDIKMKGLRFDSEIGVGRIVNPSTDGNWAGAFAMKGEITKKISPIPVSLEYYNISHDVASVDGGIVNSNMNYEDGGAANEYLYDNMLYVNLAQEVGMVANNRHGFTLKTEGKIGKLKIEVGLSASQEKENKYDTITFQHRVNAFSRSRFRPWFQAGGPYGRIKSFWLRTFETVTVTDEASGISTDYKKGFNGADLFLKYQAFWLQKKWVLLSYTNYNSIQDKFSILPVMNNDDAFITTLYEDVTVACEVKKGLTIEANFGIEKVNGSDRIQMADADGIEIQNASGNPIYSDEGLRLDQIGTSYGFGIDYDFTKTAGIHLRHKWMNHKDLAFTADKFKGHETTFELKIFF